MDLSAVGRRRLDGPRQAAPLGLPLRLLRRLELGLGVHQSVLGKVAAVLPEVAPDAENAFERLSDDAGREGLEGDRSLVARLHQRPEHAREIDRPRAHVAAMGIAGMEIAEIVAGLQNGLLDVGFLNVHMIDVKMSLHIRRPDPLAHFNRLRRRVEHVELVAIHDLETEHDVASRRDFRHALQHLC